MLYICALYYTGEEEGVLSGGVMKGDNSISRGKPYPAGRRKKNRRRKNRRKNKNRRRKKGRKGKGRKSRLPNDESACMYCSISVYICKALYLPNVRESDY